MPFYGSSAPVAANASSPATRTPFPPGPQAAHSKPKSTWKNATLGSSQLSMREWERAGTHGLRGTVGRFRFRGSWRLRALRLLPSLRIHSQERIPTTTTTRTTTAHTCSRYRRLRPHQHTPLPHRRPRISRTRLPGPGDAARLGLMLLRGLGGTASRPRHRLHRPTPTAQRTSSRALKLGRGRGQGAKSRF